MCPAKTTKPTNVKISFKASFFLQKYNKIKHLKVLIVKTLEYIFSFMFFKFSCPKLSTLFLTNYFCQKNLVKNIVKQKNNEKKL